MEVAYIGEGEFEGTRGKMKAKRERESKLIVFKAKKIMMMSKLMLRAMLEKGERKKKQEKEAMKMKKSTEMKQQESLKNGCAIFVRMKVALSMELMEAIKTRQVEEKDDDFDSLEEEISPYAAKFILDLCQTLSQRLEGRVVRR
jgi:hypothetical protein